MVTRPLALSHIEIQPEQRMNPDSSSQISSTVPQVSICLPVFNASRFLVSAMAAIARQTFRNFEVVVVDDGSTDGSADAASDLIHHHGLVGQVVTQTNRGPEQARDRCVELARANLLAPFDADDAWSPDYLERMVSVFERHPEVDVVYCDFVEVIQSSGHHTRKSTTTPWVVCPSPAADDASVFVFPRGTFFPMLLQGQVLFPPCTMFRRPVYDLVGGYSRRLPCLKISLDWYFGLVAARESTVAYLNEPLLTKSRHDSNISGNSVATAVSDVTVLEALLADQNVPREQVQLAQSKASRRSLDAAYGFYEKGQLAECRRLVRRSLQHRMSAEAIRLYMMSLVPRRVIDSVRDLVRSR